MSKKELSDKFLLNLQFSWIKISSIKKLYKND